MLIDCPFCSDRLSLEILGDAEDHIAEHFRIMREASKIIDQLDLPIPPSNQEHPDGTIQT